MSAPLLMSAENPNGRKLEELLAQLQEEVQQKSVKIAQDARPHARHVLRNNQQIIGLLMQAEALQRNSYDVLAQLGPNQGPTGTPRTGPGSAQ